MEKKFLDNIGLGKIITKIKELLEGKVEKIEGKGLSTVDFTTAYETKLKGIATGAEVNKINSVSVNGSDLPINSKKVNIEIPDVSEFQTADEVETAITGKGYQTATDVESAISKKGYQTSAQVSSAIASAIKGIQGIKYSVVTALPESGEAGTIYLISNSGSGKNIYDEYIWITDKFELLGTTEVDLSGYLKSSELVAITDNEIEEMFTE